LHVLQQRGGWPLSMFLTPDGKPILGGTYWPADDKEVQGTKIRGFKSILQFMVQVKAEKPKEVQEQAERVAEATAAALGNRVPGRSLVALDRELVDLAVRQVAHEFDKEYGGFGSPERGFRGTKFPVPSSLELLLHESGRTPSAELDN